MYVGRRMVTLCEVLAGLLRATIPEQHLRWEPYCCSAGGRDFARCSLVYDLKK